MSVLRRISSKFVCPGVTIYEEIEYQKDLATVRGRFDGKLLPELGPWLVLLCGLFSYLYFSECFKYWPLDCPFKLRFKS